MAMILMTGSTILKTKYIFNSFVIFMINFPRIKISCVQVNGGSRKLHDLPVFVTVFDIQDLRKLPTPRIFILIFLQVKSINIRFKYKIYILGINTYIFVLSTVSNVLF